MICSDLSNLESDLTPTPTDVPVEQLSKYDAAATKGFQLTKQWDSSKKDKEMDECQDLTEELTERVTSNMLANTCTYK